MTTPGARILPWEGQPQPHPILATAVIPWTERYAFDEGIFRREVRAIAEGLTRHIYIFGTAGEGHAVTDSQFGQIASAFWKVSGECGVRPMAGVISLSLGTVVERIARARDLGFREFQISLPAWGALTDGELDRFFAETCGRFPDCFFLHYNVARAKRMLTAADYRRLEQAHPNLVAVKATGVDAAQAREFLTAVPRLKFYFTEPGYVAGRKAGPCGLLISMASMHHGLARRFVDGDDALREEFAAEFRAIGQVLKDKVSRGRLHMDGAFDQMIFRVNHPWFPTRLLPPYEGPSEEDFRLFRESLPARWKAENPPSPAPS